MTSQALTQPRKYSVTHIWHADWSISVKARWVAKARRTDTGWLIHTIEPVGMLHQFRQSLTYHGQGHAVWLGLDMPIGFATHWYDGANIQDFNQFVNLIFSDEWSEFFNVCTTKGQITHKRPFYPKSARIKGSVKRKHLVSALGLSCFEDLHRHCEFATRTRNAACPSFWTLGANQVGKGMLHGLEHLIIPGYRDGYNIWPFVGDLAACTEKPGVTLIETYPGEVYGWLELSDLTKSNQESRAKAVNQLITHAQKNGIEISPAVKADIHLGFGTEQGKDDAFDALVGVLGLILIADGKQGENLPHDANILKREGWIVGMDATTLKPPQNKRAG